MKHWGCKAPASFLLFLYLYYYNGTTKENLIPPGVNIMDEPIYGDIYTVDTSNTTIICG